MNRNTTRLLVPNDVACLPIIGSYVAEVARQAGLPEYEVVQVRFAVGEACQNVLQHAYPAGVEAPFQVTCEITADQLRIMIWDGGPFFDLARVPPPNLQADVTRRRIGGLGLHLIRQWMDEVELCPCAEGKELRLTKYIRQQREGTSR